MYEKTLNMSRYIIPVTVPSSKIKSRTHCFDRAQKSIKFVSLPCTFNHCVLIAVLHSNVISINKAGQLDTIPAVNNSSLSNFERKPHINICSKHFCIWGFRVTAIVVWKFNRVRRILCTVFCGMLVWQRLILLISLPSEKLPLWLLLP
jgi:hypothetical protein